MVASSPSEPRRIPLVLQHEAADCGAACLAMVLGAWGHEVQIAALRDELDCGAGLRASRLLDVAARHGLQGQGLKLGAAHLQRLPRGSILHWEFCHFVVFDGVRRRGVDILDPARGRRCIPWEEVGRCFTGVALTFRPSADFVQVRARRPSFGPYLARLFSDATLLSRVLAMSLLVQLFAVALPVLTGVVVDRVVPRHDVDLLWVIGGGAAFTVLFGAIGTLLRAHLLVVLRLRLDLRMTTDFVHHLVRLPHAYFLRRSVGDLMMRVNANATVREFLTSNALSSLLDAAWIGIYLLGIALVSPPVMLLVVALGLARVVVVLVARPALTDAVAAQLDAQGRAQGELAQMLAGIETLKVAGAEARRVGHWSNVYGKELNAAARRGRVTAIAEAVLYGLSTLSPLLVLGYATLAVLDGAHTLGQALAIAALAQAFFTPLTALVDSALRFTTLGGHLARMDDVLSTSVEQAPAPTLGTPRLRGAITLRGVSFRYPGEAVAAIDAVDLDIAPGQVVALVGASGSGKTTLARLMLGLYRPTRGQVAFDGHDLGTLDAAVLRRQIGVVPQQPYFFAASVRDNIALVDPGAPLTRIAHAARLAEIDRDIAALPLQYDTVLADRGESLSGGQRQRLAIARAVLTRPPILLFDEATSALDAPTEHRIMERLRQLRCTQILIAHRLSTIRRADLIVVVDRGRIVATGRHDELCATHALYRGLVAAQEPA